MNCGMSALGTKQTSASALHMSAFGGKADTIKLPALKIFLGCIATALAPLSLIGGWQGAGCDLSPGVRTASVLSGCCQTKPRKASIRLTI